MLVLRQSARERTPSSPIEAPRRLPSQMTHDLLKVIHVVHINNDSNRMDVLYLRVVSVELIFRQSARSQAPASSMSLRQGLQSLSKTPQVMKNVSQNKHRVKERRLLTARVRYDDMPSHYQKGDCQDCE